MTGPAQENQPESSNALPEAAGAVPEATGPSVTRGFERLAAFVEEFNSTCQKGRELNLDDLKQAFQSADAVNDAILSSLAQKDIEEIAGVSPVIARALHKVFSRIEEPGQRRMKRRPTPLTVKSLHTEELLVQYDPSDVASAVTAELKQRVNVAIGRNPRVVVFQEDGTVDARNSWSLLQDALKGDPDLDQTEVAGQQAFTYRIGERPDQVSEIHPITREALRSNGMGSDGLNWGELPLEVRQLLYLGVQTGEIDEEPSRRDLVYYFDIAGSKGGLGRLQRELKDAARKFVRLDEISALPPQRRHREDATDLSEEMFESTRRSDW